MGFFLGVGCFTCVCVCFGGLFVCLLCCCCCVLVVVGGGGGFGGGGCLVICFISRHKNISNADIIFFY